jgi:hypothetical protein
MAMLDKVSNIQASDIQNKVAKKKNTKPDEAVDLYKNDEDQQS